MAAWIKRFVDSTEEYGSDRDIEEGKASWSKGRLEGIKECVLSAFGHEVIVSIPDTEWHQFDRMEVPVSVGQHMSIRRARVLQVKIKATHTLSFIKEVLMGSHIDERYNRYFDKRHYSLLEKLPDCSVRNHNYIEVEQKHLDKWFTIMIDDMGVHISFADKGNF